LQWHPDKVALRRRQKERGSDGINYNDEKSGRDVHKVVPPPPPPPPGSDDQRIIKGQDGHNNNNDIDNNKQNEHDQDEEYARNQLQKIQHAYEILSDDHNRLLYHKYGLIGGTDAAVQLLTGRAISASAAAGGGIMNDGGATTAEQIRLLELMGYHHTHQSQQQYPSSSASTASHQQRIHTLTTTITEYLRPLVEGTISQENFVSQIHSEMNTLKKSPLGAQILRCVGRAYKVEGWRVLRQMREEKYRQRYGRSYSQHRHRHHNRHHSSSSRKRNGQKNSRVDDILQDSWRSTKHYASAAYASGKLVLMEQKLKKLEEDQLRQKEERRRKKRMREEEEDRLKRIQGSDTSNNHVFSSNIGSLSDDEDEEFDIGSFSDIDLDNNDSDSDMMMFSASESEDSDDDDDEIEYELQHIQNQKAYTALLSLHQMEALWKVTKIELDRTVREACRWILAPTPSVPAIAAGGGRSEGGGWYAFCPSEQSPYQEDWQHYQASPPPPPPPPPPPSSHHGEHHFQQRHHQHRRRLRQQRHQQHRRPRQHSKADGWVGLNGQVVPMEVGRLRAAAAMVLVGDIMVRCSKEGTAWKKNK